MIMIKWSFTDISTMKMKMIIHRYVNYENENDQWSFTDMWTIIMTGWHPPYSSLPQPVTMPTASRNFSLLSLGNSMMMVGNSMMVGNRMMMMVVVFRSMYTLAYRWGPHGVVSQWGFRAQEWQCRSQRWVPGSPCAPPPASPEQTKEMMMVQIIEKPA